MLIQSIIFTCTWEFTRNIRGHTTLKPVKKNEEKEESLPRIVLFLERKILQGVATENSVRREVNYKNVSSLRNQLNIQTTSGFDDMKDRVEVISLSRNIKRMIGAKERFQYKNALFYSLAQIKLRKEWQEKRLI